MGNLFLGVLLGAAIGYGISRIRVKNNQNEEFEICHFEIVKFSDIISLSKIISSNISVGSNEILVLLKRDNEFILTYYNENKKQVYSGKSFKIYSNEMDESLRLAFGDKDMIIIE